MFLFLPSHVSRFTIFRVLTVLYHLTIIAHFYKVEGGTIMLKEVLRLMDSGALFSIMFITADKRKEDGGEEVTIINGKKSTHLTTREAGALAKAQPKTALAKNPNHYLNSTRNIRLQNGGLRKVHIRLIRQFNGKTVL